MPKKFGDFQGLLKRDLGTMSPHNPLTKTILPLLLFGQNPIP